MASFDVERVRRLISFMKMRNVIHKGSRRFIEDADASGLQPAVVIEVLRIGSFLHDMEREGELRNVPGW